MPGTEADPYVMYLKKKLTFEKVMKLIKGNNAHLFKKVKNFEERIQEHLANEGEFKKPQVLIFTDGGVGWIHFVDGTRKIAKEKFKVKDED